MLTIKNNQKHEFSNFWEAWSLKSYYVSLRIASDTTCLLKDAGNIFLFKAGSGKVITCKLLSKLKNQKHEFIFSIWSFFMHSEQAIAFRIFLRKSKVLNNSKICLFNCEPIFHVMRFFKKSCGPRKRLPAIFEIQCLSLTPLCRS